MLALNKPFFINTLSIKIKTMIKYTITILFFIILFLSSCSDNIDDNKTDLPFEKMEYALTCGWCLIDLSIEIAKDGNVTYTETIPCPLQINSRERTLTDEEKQDIKNAFDLETILNIELDECGACVDGCDDTIILKSSDGTEQFIRYDNFSAYSELEEIKELVEVLSEVRSSFN